MIWIIFTINMFVISIMCYVVAGVSRASSYILIGTFAMSLNIMTNIIPTIYGMVHRKSMSPSNIEDGQFGLGFIGLIMSIIVTCFVTWVFETIYGYI